MILFCSLTSVSALDLSDPDFWLLLKGLPLDLLSTPVLADHLVPTNLTATLLSAQ